MINDLPFNSSPFNSLSHLVALLGAPPNATGSFGFASFRATLVRDALEEVRDLLTLCLSSLEIEAIVAYGRDARL